jgi:ribose transport system permease protein
MNAVAAVVLGGASLNGGKGKIENTLLAVLVLGMLSNGFVLMGLSTYTQDVARGIILLLSVGIDEAKNRGKAK